MGEIKHIVFDIGRVLIHWNPELSYIDLIPDEDERKWFLAEVCSPAWNLEQDRGRCWREAEDLLIAQFPDKADLIRAYRLHWIKSVPHAYQDVVALYRKLIAEGRDVTLLSNFNQDTFLEVQAKYPLMNEARGETVSGHIRLIKPDRAIYRHHQDAFDLTPERTLFIDDSADNVAAARQEGWQAIQFTGGEGALKLEKGLASFGIA